MLPPVKYTGIPDEFYQESSETDVWVLAKKYVKSERTIQRWRKLIGLELSTPPIDMGVIIPFPDPQVRNFGDEGYLSVGGDTIITSDWHVPYHNLELAENMVRVAKSQGIKQLAIVGDFFDAATLSKFDPREIEFGVRDELATSTKILEQLLAHFDTIYYSGGNHEARLLRMLKFQVGFPDIVKWLTTDPRVISTDRDTMIHDGGEPGVPYRLVHPASYSQSSCTVAVKLAIKKDMHVMSAHGHFQGWRVSPNGRYLGIDLGGMFDVDKVAYINTGGETTHPTWNPGFWIIQNGYPTPYSNLLTDWSVYHRSGLTLVHGATQDAGKKAA